MKFTVVGVGPGDPDLITVSALKIIKNASLVLAPRSRLDRAGVAERIVKAHLPDVTLLPVLFPMTEDADARDAELTKQLEALRPAWQAAKSAVLPVIGDSTLYATGFYLYELWKRLVPGLELALAPGISAHCLASARASSFLAMGQEILAVVPATAPGKKIVAALRGADSAALYKPSALGGFLREIVESAGPWSRIVRVDRAGLPDEKILEGGAALEPAGYLSILLLWRR